GRAGGAPPLRRRPGAPHPASAMIGFRPLAAADFPLMHRWLNEEHVRRWWTPGYRTVADVAAKYGPYAAGQKPTRPYLILHDGQPIGYAQTYLLRDYPDYARCVALDEAAAGVDLFIGEPAFVHRGLGAPILHAFLDHVVFARPDVTACVIG